ARAVVAQQGEHLALLQMQADVHQGGHRAEALADVLDAEHVGTVDRQPGAAVGLRHGPRAVRFRRTHRVLPARLSLASCTFAIMAPGRAPRRRTGWGLALTPTRWKRSNRIASPRVPGKAPTIVPAPPASAVPPMTAPAMA